MDRREFLKLSTLFAAAMAIESSPALRAAARIIETNPHNPLTIVLYKVRKKSNGRWYVKGSKYVDLAHKRFDTDLFYKESFTVLDIVDNSLAKERRKELALENDCTKPHHWGHFNFQIFTSNGKKSVITNKRSGQLDRFRESGWVARDLMIQTGEWKPISQRGGFATKNWPMQKQHMQSIQKIGKLMAAEANKVKAKKTNSSRIEELLDVMERGVYYTADELTDLFPWFHEFSYPQKATRRFILRNLDHFNVINPSHQLNFYSKR